MSDDKIPDVAADDLLNPVASGYLEKKRPTKKFVPDKFQRRWCVIYDRVFYYYERRTDRKQRGAFFLKGYQVKPSDWDDLGFLLVNATKERSYQFKAPSSDELIKWKQSVFKASRGGKHSSMKPQASIYEDTPSNIPINKQPADRGPISTSRSQEDISESYEDRRQTPSMSPSGKPLPTYIKQRTRSGSCPVVQVAPPVCPEIRRTNLRQSTLKSSVHSKRETSRQNSQRKEKKTKRSLPPVPSDFDYGNASESYSDYSDSEVSFSQTRRRGTSPLVSMDSGSLKSGTGLKIPREKALPEIPNPSGEDMDTVFDAPPPIPERINTSISKCPPPPPPPKKRGQFMTQSSVASSVASSYTAVAASARSDDGLYDSSTDYESINDDSYSSTDYEDVEQIELSLHNEDDESIYSRVTSGCYDYRDSDEDQEGYVTKINKRSSSRKKNTRLSRKSKTEYSYNVSGMISDDNEQYVNPKDNVFLHDDNGYLIIVPFSLVEDDHVEYSTIESLRGSRIEEDIYSSVNDICVEALQNSGKEDDRDISEDSDDCSDYVNLVGIRLRKRNTKEKANKYVGKTHRGHTINGDKMFSHIPSGDIDKRVNLKVQGSLEDESNSSEEDYDVVV